MWSNPNNAVDFDTFNADGRSVNDPDFMVVDGITTGSMRQARVALRFSY